VKPAEQAVDAVLADHPGNGVGNGAVDASAALRAALTRLGRSR
jgi:hypothetical protein